MSKPEKPSVTLKAICPLCQEAVEVRPGNRLLKHGEDRDPHFGRPACERSGTKVNHDAILAWARRNVRWRKQEMERSTNDRVAYEGHLARMVEQEKTDADKLAAAEKVLADLEAQAPR